jgi:hypothetical protein
VTTVTSSPTTTQRTFPDGRTVSMTATVAAEVDRLGLVNPDICLICGDLFELVIATAEPIKRPRARKIDGYTCGPLCQAEAKHLAGIS